MLRVEHSSFSTAQRHESRLGCALARFISRTLASSPSHLVRTLSRGCSQFCSVFDKLIHAINLRPVSINVQRDEGYPLTGKSRDTLLFYRILYYIVIISCIIFLQQKKIKTRVISADTWLFKCRFLILNIIAEIRY